LGMGTLKGTYKRASDVHVSGQGIWDAGLSSRLRRTDVRVRAAPRGLCGRYGFWAGLLLRGGELLEAPKKISGLR
jgi:hypothetical protein